MWSLGLMLLFLIAAAAQEDAAQVQATSLADERITGRIVSLNSNAVTLETASGNQTIAADDLLEVTQLGTQAQRNNAAFRASLADGSQLFGTEIISQEKDLLLDFSNGLQCTLPLARLTTLQFGELGTKEAVVWADLRSREFKSDVLVFRRGEAVDYEEGIVQQILPDVVVFSVDGDPIRVKRPRVVGLLFYRPASAIAPVSKTVVTLNDGNRLAASQIALAESRLTVTGFAAEPLVLDWAAVVQIDFGQSKVQFLARLKPVASSWQPYLPLVTDAPSVTEFFEPQLTPASDLPEAASSKSLVIPSQSTVEYAIPQGFKRFVTTVGISPAGRPKGHVLCRVRTEHGVLWEQSLLADQPAQPLSLELQGATRLLIDVEFGEGQDRGDLVEFQNAKITR